MAALKQRTITVDGETVQIKSRPRTHLGNAAGFYVYIGRPSTCKTRYHVGVLYREEAEERALTRWKEGQR